MALSQICSGQDTYDIIFTFYTLNKQKVWTFQGFFEMFWCYYRAWLLLDKLNSYFKRSYRACYYIFYWWNSTLLYVGHQISKRDIFLTCVIVYGYKHTVALHQDSIHKYVYVCVEYTRWTDWLQDWVTIVNTAIMFNNIKNKKSSVSHPPLS